MEGDMYLSAKSSISTLLSPIGWDRIPPVLFANVTILGIVLGVVIIAGGLRVLLVVITLLVILLLGELLVGEGFLGCLVGVGGLSVDVEVVGLVVGGFV